MHPDVVVRYPQSGETFKGRDNYLGMLANYPGLPEGDVKSVKGDSTTGILNPTLPMMAPKIVVFGGDDYILEAVATYPDGGVYNVVVIIRLHGGLVFDETDYYAAPFEAPEWRRPYTDVDT